MKPPLDIIDQEINTRVGKFLIRVRHMLSFRSVEEQSEILTELRENLNEHIRNHTEVDNLLDASLSESIDTAISAWESPETIGLGYLNTLPLPSDVSFLDTYAYGLTCAIVASAPLLYDFLFPYPIMLVLARIGAVFCLIFLPLIVGWNFGFQASNYTAIFFKCLKYGKVWSTALISMAFVGLMWNAVQTPVHRISLSGSLESHVSLLENINFDTNFIVGAGAACFLMIAAAATAGSYGSLQRARIA